MVVLDISVTVEDNAEAVTVVHIRMLPPTSSHPISMSITTLTMRRLPLIVLNLLFTSINLQQVHIAQIITS